jgi:hypothetical protein
VPAYERRCAQRSQMRPAGAAFVLGWHKFCFGILHM